MKQTNRWFYAIIGVIINLFAGMVYAWSTLSRPIAAEYPDWTAAQLSLTFTIVMIMFCVGVMAGGFLGAKFSERTFLMASGVIFLLGFIVAAAATTPIVLYLGFGILCGFASGLAYSVVMGSVGKWFPDKQGAISGILLMGFGISSFIVGKVYQAFIDGGTSWRAFFRVFGILSLVILVICSFFIKKPGADFVPPKASAKSKKWNNPLAMEVKTPDMMRRVDFWLYYLWAILLSAAGMALLSQASAMAREAGSSVSAGTIATVVGLISIFNGVGRVILGAGFDKIGRRALMQINNGIFIVAILIIMLALKTKSFPLIVVGFIVGGFAYGGITPTNSAYVSSYFGLQNYSKNFSIINTNIIIASFGSVIAGALYDASQSYISTCVMMVVLVALGVLASFGISCVNAKMMKDKK